MICIDLMDEWLWTVRTKISKAEYCICLATFILIQILGVEFGIIAGVGLYLLCRQFGMDVGETKGSEATPVTENDSDQFLDVSLSPRLNKASYGSTQT
jgi:MFS superfamily sulfate permease-like transporter